MGLPASASIISSVSSNDSPSRRAIKRPTVLLPLPDMPTRMRLRLLTLTPNSRGCHITPEVPVGLFDVVAAELFENRVGQHHRHHRLADHAASGHLTDVAALVVGVHLRARNEIKRGLR